MATRATALGKMTQNNGHYAAQGHSRSPLSVSIESPYATSYVRIVVTYLISRTVFKTSRSIGQILAEIYTNISYNLANK